MIMIVDDSALIRAIIKEHVRNFMNNQEIYECSDGHEAIDAYRRLHPEWVLMDIKMPRMDGLSAMKSIREQFPCARIIIVTNFDDPYLREAAQKSGATG